MRSESIVPIQWIGVEASACPYVIVRSGSSSPRIFPFQPLAPVILKRERRDQSRFSAEFTPAFNIVQRESWLWQLSRQFRGASRKYPSDKWKIIGATACLCDDFLAKWGWELGSKLPEEREKLENTWQLVVNWTLTPLPWKWFDIEVELMWMLERAQQMPPRDPEDFIAYLVATEREVDRLFKDRPEKRSALAFFAAST